MEGFRNLLLDPVLSKVVYIFAGISIITLVVRFLQWYLTNHIRTLDARYRARKVLSFAGYIAVFLLILGIFNERLSNLSAAFGIAGAGIAFALQEVIVSVAGWIALSFSNFYKPGDRVQLGGIKGDVIEIGVIRTTLMEVGEWVAADQYSGRIVRIANSFVFKEPVFNYSGDFPFLWDEIVIKVKHGSDRALAVKILYDAAHAVTDDYTKSAKETWPSLVRKYHILNTSMDPAVTLEVTDNWLAYTLRYVVDYAHRRSTRNELFTRIMDRVEQTEGRVAIASTTFQLVEMPALNVHVHNE